MRQYNQDLLPGGILGLNSNYINQYVKYRPTVVSRSSVFEAEITT
jgi:ribonucleoside-diphosphate reductase beta chain